MPRRLIVKVALGALLFLMLLSLGLVFDLANTRSMHGLLGHLSDVIALRLLESSEFDTHVTRTIREVQTYVLAGEEDELEEAVEALEQAEQDLAALRAINSMDGELDGFTATYGELNDRRQALLDRLATVLERVASRDATERVVFAEIELIEREVETLSVDSRVVLDAERALATTMAAESVRQTYVVVAAGILLPVVFLLGALRFLHRGIVRPIRALAAANQAFAEDRLHDPVVVSSTDEIGVLQRSFNTLVATIRRQTQALVEQAIVAEGVRAQAQAAQQFADALAERNVQIAEQATALHAEISERKLVEVSLIQTRDAAQAASRAKSAFLATMSHELRTPLTAILGYSQLAAQMVKEVDYGRVHDDLQHIQAAGKHLLALINDVLDLSRIEAGKLPLAYSTFAVADLVDEVATTVQPLLERGANRFHVSCPPAIGTMHSDATKVRQTLLNLLSNAAKFTESGMVSLSVSAAECEGRRVLRFAVADTGIGIHASDMPRLFQTFTQLDDSATRKYGGTGLGLALSQRLAETLGGTISVTSTYGAGSVFILELPAQWEALSPDSAPHSGVLTAPGAGVAALPSYDAARDLTEVCDILALCIDDDPAVGNLLTRLLSTAQIAVVCAQSGQAGLELARDLQPDIILLDVLMPDLDGWEVLARLKADPELAGIPIVMLSIDERQQYGLALGAAEYLVKPIEPERLIAAVRRHSLTLPAPDLPEQRRVLLIEADPACAESLHQSLERDGWAVAEVATGAAALAALAKAAPHAIVLDLVLPELDAVQAIEALRHSPAWCGVPIVVLAGEQLSAAERGRLQDSVTAILDRGTYPIDAVIAELRELVQHHSGRAPAQSVKDLYADHPGG